MADQADPLVERLKNIATGRAVEAIDPEKGSATAGGTQPSEIDAGAVQSPPE